LLGKASKNNSRHKFRPLFPAGEVISTNDDGARDRNALIENFILPDSGTYTIIARDLNNSGEGLYTLELFLNN
jgi:hypothetical protein